MVAALIAFSTTSLSASLLLSSVVPSPSDVASRSLPPSQQYTPAHVSRPQPKQLSLPHSSVRRQRRMVPARRSSTRADRLASYAPMYAQRA